MKQMQKGYNEVQALEIELRILETTSAPPSRPRKLLWDALITRGLISRILYPGGGGLVFGFDFDSAGHTQHGLAI